MPGFVAAAAVPYLDRDTPQNSRREVYMQLIPWKRAARADLRHGHIMSHMPRREKRPDAKKHADEPGCGHESTHPRIWRPVNQRVELGFALVSFDALVAEMLGAATAVGADSVAHEFDSVVSGSISG